MKKAILISISAAAVLSIAGGIVYARTAAACPMMGHSSASHSTSLHKGQHGMGHMQCPMSSQCPMMTAAGGHAIPSGMGGMHHSDGAGSASSHSGTAAIRSIDPANGTVTLAHGPIASINWPAMTMEFKLKDKSLAEGLRAGDSVTFQFIRNGRDYLVTDIRAAGK